MRKTIGWIVTPLILGMLVLVLAANSAPTDAADPLTALVERLDQLERKVKALEMRITALTMRVSQEHKDSLRMNTDSASPRRKAAPVAPQMPARGSVQKKDSVKKKTSSYVPRKEPEGYRASPIGISPLFGAARQILDGKTTSAGMIGKKTIVTGKLLTVSKQGGTYRVTVRYQDKLKFPYIGIDGPSPLDVIIVSVPVGLDSPVAKLKKGVNVTVRGTIRIFQVRRIVEEDVGVEIRMTLEDGQAN